MTEGEEGGEKARGCPCVADEEFGLGCGNPSAQVCDGHFAVGLVELNIKAEVLQGAGEVTRVVGEEGIGEAGCPIGKRGDE